MDLHLYTDIVAKSYIYTYINCTFCVLLCVY